MHPPADVLCRSSSIACCPHEVAAARAEKDTRMGSCSAFDIYVCIGRTQKRDPPCTREVQRVRKNTAVLPVPTPILEDW